MGRLVLTPEGVAAFEYDGEFLETGFSISPIHLPLKPGLFLAEETPFDGNFGVFNDSLPDGWGNFILVRYLASQGISMESLSLLDRLSLVGSNGMGALEYYPDQPIQAENDTNDLNFLAGEVKKVLTEAAYSEHLKLLVEKGGAPGGARPKVLISHNKSSWIVKFPGPSNPPDIGMQEFVNSKIASKCGVLMPPTRLFEGKYFGVKRFDRKKQDRVHMLTASGLLNASHLKSSLDYIDLINLTFVLTKNIVDCYRLFRLMVYNVLTGNGNDHSKNFSFLYSDNEWSLSPAYDLVPKSGLDGNHVTTIAGQSKPGKKQMFDVARQCGLKSNIASTIYDEVYENCAPIRLKKF